MTKTPKWHQNSESGVHSDPWNSCLKPLLETTPSFPPSVSSFTNPSKADQGATKPLSSSLGASALLFLYSDSAGLTDRAKFCLTKELLSNAQLTFSPTRCATVYPLDFTLVIEASVP